MVVKTSDANVGVSGLVMFRQFPHTLYAFKGSELLQCANWIDVNTDKEPHDQTQYQVRFKRVGDADRTLWEDTPIAACSLAFDQWLDGVEEEEKREMEQEQEQEQEQEEEEEEEEQEG